MSVSVNIELNKSDAWKDKVCEQCGRKYPETLLNIEGNIHHHSSITCIDKKSCRRARRHKR